MNVVETIVSLVGAGETSIGESHPNFADIRAGLRKATTRVELLQKHRIVAREAHGNIIVIGKVGNGAAAATPTPASPVRVPVTKIASAEHTYQPPAFTARVLAYLQDSVPFNLWFWGATGCGKTLFVQHIGKTLNRKIFRINCCEEMTRASVLGDKTVDVDEKSLQNFIRFAEGQLVLAMKEGTDSDGKEVGEPGILYVDEAGAMPARVSIALNRVLETACARREITIDDDGGRVVRSHSGFRIIFSANTQGRGLVNASAAGYTAQSNALDASVLDRMTITVQFGYDRKAEKNILTEKMGDDAAVAKLLTFRDAIRGRLKTGDLSTMLSTRGLVAIADAFRVTKSLPQALYDAMFGKLLDEERPIWNETAVAVLGCDILAAHGLCSDMDYL